MLIEQGSQKLREFTEASYQEKHTKVTDGVWHISGLGHSNAVVIEGKTGVILIDTLDSLERGRKLLSIIREKTGKDVGTIIYTHGHPDHRGGAGAFLESNPEVIAFATKTAALERTGLLKDIQNLRGYRQFGYGLTDEENISQGIGPREGEAYGEQRAFVPPSVVYGQAFPGRQRTRSWCGFLRKKCCAAGIITMAVSPTFMQSAEASTGTWPYGSKAWMCSCHIRQNTCFRGIQASYTGMMI